MKILRLRLTNLNSLRGTNEVDFTQAPLAGCGLFAITGPTGAGKSTLLDAITLALYGRVARYGAMPSPDAMMSRHTGECSAEVEFACAAGEFRSVWQLQRARKKADGKVQQAKRRVIALPAEAIIAESIKEADAKILELTGLDYDRFLRSVLLAQGDFAAFLKAGAKERTDLLQQVTGTGVYQDISQAAFRRAADAEQALDLLRRTHEAVAVLAPELRAQHEATLAARRTRLAELQALVPALERRLEDARRWRELERATGQLQTDQAAQTQAMRDAAADLERLARHEKAAPFVADLTTLDLLASDAEKDAAARNALDAAAPHLLQTVADARTTSRHAAEALAREANRVTEQRVVWAEVADLDTALATAREALRQLEIQQARDAVQLSAAAAASAAAEAALKATLAEHHDATVWLEQHQIDAPLAARLPEIQAAHARRQAADDAATAAEETLTQRRAEEARVQAEAVRLEHELEPRRAALARANAAVTAALAALESATGPQPLAGLESSRDLARERRQTLANLAAEAARIRTHQADFAKLRREADAAGGAWQQAAAEVAQLTKDHDAAAALLAARREALSFAEKVQSLESHRATLRENEPCPLCGGTHHPYVRSSDTPAGAVAAVRAQVSTAEAAAHGAQQQLRAAETRRARHEADAQRLAADAGKLAAEVTRLTLVWNADAAPHGLANRLEDEAGLAAAGEAARADEARRDAQLAAARHAEALLTAARGEARTAETAFAQADTEQQKQTALLTHLREQLPALERTLGEHRRKSGDAKHAWERETAGFGSTGPEAGLMDALKRRADTFALRRKAADDLHAAVGSKRATFDACVQQGGLAQARVTTAGAKVTEAQKDVDQRERQRREKFGGKVVADARREAEALLHGARTEAEARRKDLEARQQAQEASATEHARLSAAMAVRHAQRTQLADQLKSQAIATGLADVPAVRAALLTTAEATSLGLRRAALENRRTVLQTQWEGIATRRGELPPAAAADAAQTASLEEEKSARDAERTAVLGTLAEQEALLKHDDGMRLRQAAVTEQIQAANREFARWQKLRALIGSADGSLFARFAQGLTLEHLTVLANRHLRELNPRYSIRRAADGETGDLELEIIDHYQADAARPMRSLSGGESFLVSLALALGLSKLASGRTSIESLFIDEGFGSLDADTLEVAMSALENLQAGGKVIGVISHVPAMQERISVQIAVAKESGGCSRIELRS